MAQFETFEERYKRLTENTPATVKKSVSTSHTGGFEETYKRLTGNEAPPIDITAEFQPSAPKPREQKPATPAELAALGIFDADRQFMMKVNNGAVRDPIVLPSGNPAQLEQQKQAQFARNAQNLTGQAVEQGTPLYPGGTVLPKDPYAIPSTLDTTINQINQIRNFADPANYGVIKKSIAGAVKGISAGAVNPERGTIGFPIVQNFFPGARMQLTRPLPEQMIEQGVSEDIANNPYIGLPGELAGSIAPVGAISRGLSALGNTAKIANAGTKLAKIGEASQSAPGILQKAGQVAGRIGHAATVGGIWSMTEEPGEGQTMMDNIKRGMIWGAGLQIAAEGIGAIVNANAVAERWKAAQNFKKTLAEWAYGEGYFNSPEEAKRTIYRMVDSDIKRMGGLKNFSVKQGQKMQEFIRNHSSREPINVTAETSVASPAAPANQPAAPVPESPLVSPTAPAIPGNQVRSQPVVNPQPAFGGAPGMFTPIAKPASYYTGKNIPIQEQTIVETSFPTERVVSAYSHLHLSPGNTAKVEEKMFNDTTDNLRAEIKKHLPEIEDTQLNQIVDQFKRDYLSNREKVWGAAGNAYSSAVAGASNFNSKQAERRGNALNHAEERFSHWLKDETERIESSLDIDQIKMQQERQRLERKAAAKQTERERLVEWWANLKPGDEFNIGNGPVKIAKKNKLSIITETGSKWTVEELTGVKSVDAAKIMLTLKQKPAESLTKKGPEAVPEPTFKYISSFTKRVDSGDVTAREVKEHHRFMLDHEGEIKQSILDYINSSDKYKRKRSDTKKKLVEDTFTRELESLAYAGRDSLSYEIMTGDYQQSRRAGIQKEVDELTDEAIRTKSAAKKQYREEVEKSLDNPETLDEFRRFVSVRGEEALSLEQRAQYDELLSGSIKDRKNREEERKSTVHKVDTNVGMELVETKHTKTGEPVFVVKMGERVGREIYNDLNAKAKKLGGYYSSFRGNGAVPGFLFKTREAAEKFMALREGDVSKADIVEERKNEAKNRTAQKLFDLAERMTESANEELSRDRKTNTAKRAGEAAHAEEKAQKELALAVTIKNIAEAIESDKAKHLDGVTARTHVELLEKLFHDARNYTVRKNNEEDYRREPHVTDILNAKYPYPDKISKNILNYFINDLREKGAKAYAVRLNKKMADTAGEQVEFSGEKDFALIKGALSKAKELRIDVPWYLENTVSDYNRLQTMGIETLPQLRAALREYLQYRGETAKVDTVKAMERELVGTKIPGYFPTPKPIVDRMLREAGIKPGMSVLEPSAGKGNIADAIREAGVNPDVIEVNSTLKNILQAKGHNIVDDDFMEHEGQYDRIIMNPPFEKGQDIEHVQRAYEMLKPGGRVVAIMSAGPFYRNEQKSRNFREWLDEVGGTSEPLPEGSFKDSERSTGVNTRLVVVERVGDADINTFIDEAFSNKNESQRLRFLKISDAAATKIKNETGLDVKGYDHRFSSDDLRHIIKRHGNETSPNQVSVTKDDLKNLPDIVNDFDSVKMEKEDNGEVRLIFKKKEQGYIFYVEVVSKQKKTLSLKALWKIADARSDAGNNPPGTDVQDASQLRSSTSKNSLPQNSQNINAADFTKIEAAVKEAGFKDIEEAALAFRAEQNGLQWFKESNPDIPDPGKEFFRLQKQVKSLPEGQKTSLKLDLQRFAKKDNQVPIEDRNYEMVGKRDVRAYQQLHPDLADYIQGEAIRIIGELSDAVKGERFVSGRQGEETTVTRTSKLSSDTLNRIQEATGATYGEIAEALEAIAKGTPGINTALAKKIELIIDDNLIKGVTDIRGNRIEADNGYAWAKENVKPVTDTELFDSKQVEKLKAKHDARLKSMSTKQKAKFIRDLAKLKTKFKEQMTAQRKKYQDKLTIAKWEGKERLEQAKAAGRDRAAKEKAADEEKVNRIKYQETWRRLLMEMEAAKDKKESIAKLRNYYITRMDKMEAERRAKREADRVVAADRKLRTKLIDDLKKVRSKMRKMRPEYQRPVRAILEQLNFQKPSAKTVMSLTRIAQYLKANPNNQIPPETLEKLKRLSRKNLRDMSTDEIQTVHDTVLHYVHLNVLKNKLIIHRRVVEFNNLKSKLVQTVVKFKAKKKIQPVELSTSKSKLDRGTLDRFERKHWSIENICYELDGTKEGEFKNLFWGGADEATDNTLGTKYMIHDFIQEKMKETGITPDQIQGFSELFNTKEKEVDRIAFELDDDQEIELTKGDRIALFLHSLNDNNRASLLEGGYIPDKNRTAKIALKRSELDRLLASMSDTEKQIAGIFYDVYNDISKRLLNERSVELDGFERAMVENYYPKKVPEIEREIEKLGMKDNPFGRFTIEGQGFLKERTGAKNAIILEDAFKTMFKHIEGLSVYYGKAGYLRAAKTVLFDRDIRRQIESIDNGFTWKQMDQFMKDFEGFGVTTSEIDSALSSLLTKIDTSILGLNPKVITKQLLSYPLMFNHINPKYLIAAMGKKVDWKQIERLSPQLRERIEGAISVETGEMGRVGSVRRFFTGKEFWGSKTTRGIEAVDGITLGNTWNAVILETKDEYPNVDPDSEEFWRIVTKRAEQIFRYTQSQYDVKERSEIGRDKNPWARMFSRFTSQLNVMHNDLVRARIEFDQSGKTAGDYAKATAKFGNIILVGATLEYLINLMWKALMHDPDDKDKVRFDVKEWAANIAANTSGLFYYAGMIPNALIRALEWNNEFGANISATLLDLAEDGVKGVYNLVKGIRQAIDRETYQQGPNRGKAKFWKTFYKATKLLSASAGRLKGIPVGNVWKYSEGIYRKVTPAGPVEQFYSRLNQLEGGYKDWKKKRDEGVKQPPFKDFYQMKTMQYYVSQFSKWRKQIQEIEDSKIPFKMKFKTISQIKQSKIAEKLKLQKINYLKEAKTPEEIKKRLIKLINDSMGEVAESVLKTGQK